MAIVNPMYEAMQAYVADNGGKWAWGRCDCAGLLLRLVSLATGRTFERSDYLPPDLDYRQAVVWITNQTDIFRPFTLLLERDAGYQELGNDLRGGWDVAILSTKAPLILSDKRTLYPTHLAPGLAFYPPGMEPCILHRNGFSTFTFSWGDIVRSNHYRVFG